MVFRRAPRGMSAIQGENAVHANAVARMEHSAHDGSNGALVLIWRKADLTGDGNAVEQDAGGAGVLPARNQEMRRAVIIAIFVAPEHDAFQVQSVIVRIQLCLETTGGHRVVRFPSLRPESELAVEIGAV